MIYVQVIGRDIDNLSWGGNRWFATNDEDEAITQAVAAFRKNTNQTSLCTLEITVALENSPKRTSTDRPLPVNHAS